MNIKIIKPNITRIAVATGLILLVPLVAMQFSQEVNWTLSDFVVMGTLIFSTGLALYYVTSKVRKRYRVAACAVIVAVFLLIWVELAVGIFD